MMICKDYSKVEGFERIKDRSIKWCLHHRLETHNSDGERRLVDLSVAELKALGVYYDRPPEELIWLSQSEHSSLHIRYINAKRNEDVKNKISNTLKKYYQLLDDDTRKRRIEKLKAYATSHHDEISARGKEVMTEELKERISASTHKTCSDPEWRKRQSEKLKAYFRNHKGHSSNSGKKCYNNGKDNKFFTPGTEPSSWVQGRLICKNL